MTTIEDMIARLQALPKAMTEDAAPRVAEALRGELARTIAAGTSATGEAWAERQAGGQPLQNAMQAVGVAAVGRKVLVRLTGPESRHHFGRVKGGKARPILPTGELPPAWGTAIGRALNRCFEDWSNGRG